MVHKAVYILIGLLSVIWLTVGGVVESAYQPIRRLDPRRVSIQRRIPPNLVKGLGFSTGGGGLGSAGCSAMSADHSIELFTEEAIWFAVQPDIWQSIQDSQTQSRFTFDLNKIASQLNPTICASQPFSAQLIAPDGSIVTPHTVEDNGYYGYMMPLNALAQPGIWKLIVSNTSVEIEVPTPTQPFIMHTDWDVTEFLVGGLQPGEQVGAMLLNLDNNDLGDVVGNFQFAADEQGYALVTIDSVDPVMHPILLVGQSGDILWVGSDISGYAGHYGQPITVVAPSFKLGGTDNSYFEVSPEDSLRILYQAYWGVDGLAAPTTAPIDTSLCTRAPQDILSGYSQGRVTPGDPNNIRDTPESQTVLGQIPGGSVFNILGGPVCGAGTNLRWWYVEYNGIVGWTADGRDGIPWLEPVAMGVPSASRLCAGSPPPRLSGLLFARVVYGTGPNNIRADFESSTILGQIPEGGVFNILAGPVCGPSSYQQTWYQVEYNGIVGWTSEGYQDEYWLEPVN